jgi:putative tricarboxylic transport membrane protein
VTVAVGGLPEFTPQVEAGKLRMIAVSSPERLPGVDAPTLKEQGMDLALGTWRGLMAQPQMRKADKEAVADALAKMVATPGWQATLKKFGWLDAYQPAEGFGTFLDEQQALVESALKDLGLTK